MSLKLRTCNWSPRGTRRRGVAGFATRHALRFLAIAAIFTTYHCLDLHVRYRNSVRDKYSSTQFTILSDYDEAVLGSSGWEPDSHSSNPDRMAMLEDRPSWKRLGGGREGEAFIYNNSVIKVYNEESSPFRNCMPDTDDGTRRWPTEIPVSLIMGGHQDASTPPNDDVYSDMFVPVQDYFLATTNPSQPPKWHLVTPFLKAGTLFKLAKRLRTSENPPTYHEVDMMFRPSFESLLSALDYLHLAHNLCHDDIKMDNIFVGSETDPRRWKLGDLGNAREPEHPYHFTPLWTADTPQLRDCRANDALRLTKSYLEFIRIASGNPGDFDVAFFQGVEPASRFYWTIAGSKSPVSAATVRELSQGYPPMSEGDDMFWAALGRVEVKNAGGLNGVTKAFFGWSVPLGVAVIRELRVGAKELMGQIFGLTGILGVPIAACPGK
ncbi:hypothetical protein CkaCkLH20_06074 [Colletotrichum karsti]|uniref:Protein kinase domain-containing protein n=1 Tax=Colletotrichum karsti TaxID=1095194 RepID=A0A9P6I9X9_9PEZI|nr:uncharacterized protein CkaCkLH20_06074 [Colletotrichum karsti]KAF9876666.1 hypothetical protein CkaCkLH20_06074 [Colletotrichum karsti]